MKTYAIVLSGGSGVRAGGDMPKQYRMLDELPVLCYSLRAFENSEVEGIVIVVAEGMQDYVRKEIVEKYHIGKVTAITTGGTERYLSVWQGLQCIPKESNVLIHDGARPFVDAALIKSVIACVQEHHACIPGVPTKDTIKQVRNGQVAGTPKRSELYAVQTPQGFKTSLLYKAYEQMFLQKAAEGKIEITDDSMIIESFTTVPVHVVSGDYFNLKITTPDDFVTAEKIAKRFKKVLDN